MASDAERAEFPGCVLLPGLVNAHTHLALSVLDGLAPPARFDEWIGRVARVVVAFGHDDFRASAALGALRSLEAGVTVVGDVAYGPESRTVAQAAGLGGVFFFEIIGTEERPVADALRERGLDESMGGRTRDGVMPHSPYTVGPGLLAQARQHAAARALPFAMHVAESAAEIEYVRDGTGPLAKRAARLSSGFRPTGLEPVAYLDSLGVLDDTIAVHATGAGAEDLALLAEKAAGVVLCPRSNAYLGHGVPPASALAEAGATLALGTDSLASNSDLDVLAEARALREAHPSLTDAQLLGMVTVEGARLLGAEDRFGTLTPGLQADVVAMRVETAHDPVAGVLADGGGDRVEAVMSGGLWRIAEGEHVYDVGVFRTAADVARERALDVLGEGPESG
jgi:5-methylthioadenosine/S-adenosylhomocysteine deaminase